MNYKKYIQPKPIDFKQRTWPDNALSKAPIWCSVDLRDGNQALETPMNINQKIEFFKYLVKLGFKEIEVGFPAASDTEYDFVRRLIEESIIPDDVTIQVLTQSRPHIIDKTIESLKGAKKAIVHLYNSTSTLQRNVVFNKTKREIIDIAVEGAQHIKNLCEGSGFRYQYSPESFTGTELDYAVEICNAVIDVWQPTPDNKIIINLPSTVEMTTPNIYADQIEYVCSSIKSRDSIIISVHAHNDRGGAVASTELALLAGAERVEGTLFGNGERTGNADILNIALNLFSVGIDPKLNFEDINAAVKMYENSTGLAISKRHPYAGELVYTAFSGSHQDAIRKGMESLKKNKSQYWEIPYLPIDPLDVGRNYDPIIRINSQSGKGGVAFILEQNFNLYLPKPMQQDFSVYVTRMSDSRQTELLPQEIYDLFKETYVNIEQPLKHISYTEVSYDETVNVQIKVSYKSEEHLLTGSGGGLLEAYSSAIKQFLSIDFDIVSYSQNALESSTSSKAITYMQLRFNGSNTSFGAGISASISKSSVKALVSAINASLNSLA